MKDRPDAFARPAFPALPSRGRQGAGCRRVVAWPRCLLQPRRTPMKRFLTTAGLALAVLTAAAASPARAQYVTYYQPAVVYYGPPAPPVYSYSFYQPTVVYAPAAVIQPSYYAATVVEPRPLRPWRHTTTTYFTPT